MDLFDDASSIRDAQQDLIVARATPPGAGAVAIVRIDGRGTREFVSKLFRAVGKESPVEVPRKMVFGRWVDPQTGQVIDDGLTVFFKGPASFTGNDLAELQCHGGPVPSRRLIEAAVASGARLAEPGEFTRRAFLNGRMDLAQAEAVADLINAQTDLAARMARSQLSGSLSRKIAALREALINLAAEIEARMDFPEEGIEPADRARLSDDFHRALEMLNNLLVTRQRGKLLREGARLALVGRPNAGKSSLLNQLARIERAIVTPHAGTTRDTIECTIDLQGIPVVLIDTAGLRESEDPVEKLGIARTREEIERADLVIQVVDATEPQSAREEPSLAVRRPDLVVHNKADLLKVPTHINSEDILYVSALSREGLAELEQAILQRLNPAGMAGGESSSLAVSLRHAELLERACQLLKVAHEGFREDLPGELVMVDLREALDSVGAVIGVETGEAIIDRIFSQFCLGK